MDKHELCFQALGIRFALINIQLNVGNEKRAEEIYKEAIQWFKDNYEINKRDVNGEHDKR